MSFKGIVTRKEKDTGVTLLAKVVTENKKKSYKKQYKVRVIANGMSDREACNRDLTYVKNSFYDQGIDDLENSLNFIPVGQYGTNISYNIVNDSEDSPLTDYLDKNTGKLLGKPLYGHDDATGRIQITVSKGEESITGVVNVVIKAYGAFEVLHNSEIVNNKNLWIAIANGDSEYYLRGGKVNLITTWEPWVGTPNKISDTPLTIEWQIDDALFSAGHIEQARAAVGTTAIYTPEYKVISNLVNRGVTNVKITEGTAAGYSEYDKVLKMDGLRLTATITLGDETMIMAPFNVETNSLALTNTEVIEAIVNESEDLASGAKESTIFEIYDAGTGTDLGGYIVYGQSVNDSTNTEQVTHIDASKVSGTVFTMRILSSQSLERVALPDLLINKGNLAGTISNIAGATGPVFGFNGSDDYALNPITTQSVFGWSTRDESSKDILLTVDLAAIKDLVESGDTAKSQFCVKQALTINKYDSTEKFTTISRQFVIDNISALGNGETTDGGDNGGDGSESTE